MAQQLQQRRLGFFERYHLACSNLGDSPIITFVSRLPSPPPHHGLASTLDNTGHSVFLLAINTLLARYPLLKSSIAGTLTREPCYTVDNALSARDILRVVDVPGEVGTTVTKGTGQGWAMTPELLMQQEMTAARKWDVTKAPLWRVSVYQRIAGSQSAEQEGAVTLALTIHHALADGTGARNLFSDLLELLFEEPSTSDADPTTVPFPPSVESTINLRPPIRLLLHSGWHELIVPKLPKFLRPQPPSPHFPNPPPAPLSPQVSPQVKVLAFPATTVNILKSIGKSKGIATLHPLLHTCMVAALILTLPTAQKIKSNTPISLRDPKLGHPHATGNYISDLTIRERAGPTSSVFDTARWTATSLKSPSAVAQAKGEIGILSLLPDPKLKQGATKTGWEEFFEVQARSERPLRASLGMSNLGVLPVTGWEEKGLEIFWSQTPSTVGWGMYLNAISTTGGALTLTMVWEESAIAQALVERFWRTFETIVYRIASGTVDDGTTLAQLVKPEST